jgi:hypothetical protein
MDGALPWGGELTALLARQPPGAFVYDVRIENLVSDFIAYARSQDFKPTDSPIARTVCGWRLTRP